MGRRGFDNDREKWRKEKEEPRISLFFSLSPPPRSFRKLARSPRKKKRRDGDDRRLLYGFLDNEDRSYDEQRGKYILFSQRVISFMSTNLSPAITHIYRPPIWPRWQKGTFKDRLGKVCPHNNKWTRWNLHKSLMPGERAPQFRNCSIEPGMDGWAKRMERSPLPFSAISLSERCNTDDS